MNFKAPRSSETQSVMGEPAYIPLEQAIACDVGGGECQQLASWAYDDGAGGVFHVCKAHRPEVDALGKLVAEMPPSQIQRFESAICEAEADESRV